MMPIRQIRMLLQGTLGQRIDPLAEGLVHGRVWPTDMNLGGHMDNVRYLKLMDSARTSFFMQTGIARAAGPARITPVPVVAATHIRYRRPLGAWQAFSLATRILCWDDKWLFLEQTISHRGQPASQALVKCVFLRNDKPVAPAQVLALTGGPMASPPVPEKVRTWLAVDQASAEGSAHAA